MPIINDNTELYLDSASRYSFELYYSYDSLTNTNISIGTLNYDSLREFTWYNVGFSEFYRDTNIVDNMVSKKQKILYMEIE